ncbi:CMGC/SRPK protein kinase [Lasiodiplodia theobromae]|uniref:CMGC/SRPK protein kinase n=1 Tax=Lasiodiplodia theobromae TaxID=45133 RepID=A0A8H7ISB0_9PEZI|nr:CMGC/SRPK protein kinase [Lasiodiplodia theobromae]
MLKPFCFYLLNALDFLHTEAGLIHTDIKASNILLENKDEDVLPDMEKIETEHPSERKVIDEQRTIYKSRRMPKPKSWGYPILCDFGEARFAERKYAEYIMPEIYRAPEVILEMEWDYKVDIWNFGVMIWDLYEGKHLFDSRTDEGELSNIKHLSQIVAYLGPPPREFLEKDGSAFLFFGENGTLMDAKIPPLSFETEEENLEGRDKELFLAFMRSMLCWLPEQRKTARELLEHPWMGQK